MASVFSTTGRSSTLTTPSSTYGGASSWGRSSDKLSYSPARTRAFDPFSVRIGDYVEESWLLTCANEGRLTPKIVHLDVNAGRIRSDKDLALVLREHYEQLNRRWLSWARLRDLATVEFVQFEVHRNRFADIRATPSMPPVSANSSQSASSKSNKSLSPSEHLNRSNFFLLSVAHIFYTFSNIRPTTMASLSPTSVAPSAVSALIVVWAGV
jgi:hypothetical protein